MSYDVSTRADLHAVAYVVGELLPRADACGVELLLVGAAARDVLLSVRPARATNDVDVAVAVNTHADVARITDGLAPVPRHPNKFRVKDIEVDVVPFGAVEAADRTVTADGFRMNMLGFSEALASAVPVKLPFDVEVRVASLPAQAALKLVAWDDRRHVTGKDAIDLRSLLVEYAGDPYRDRLYDDHADVLDRHGYDPELAAAGWMGQETAALLGVGRRYLADLLGRECGDEGVLPAEMGGAPGRNRALLAAFRAGLG
jgi:predicted nucleotidyltransferase